jgi:hypothetical protein
MPALPPFDPLAVGAVDNFAFDLTADVGASMMLSTQWTCAFSSTSGATDPDPQSRIISSGVATSIPVRQADGSMITQIGAFTLAQIGGFPPSAAGGIYLLTVLTTLAPPDGRILGSFGEIPCFNPLAPLTIPIVFNRIGWVARFPEFQSVSPEAAQAYFDEATLYHSNDGTGLVEDPVEQQTLLWYLTAHLAELYRTHHGRAVNEMVGRITNVTQGPVSLATSMNADTPSEEWFLQTKYGFSYWTLTAPYRSMHYRAPRRRIYDPFFAGRAIGGFGRTW